jgi:hypothetical protein
VAEAREPERQRLHCWLDPWTRVGLITVSVERQGSARRRSTGAGDRFRVLDGNCTDSDGCMIEARALRNMQARFYQTTCGSISTIQ